VEKISYLQKVNRLSTKRKASKMNHRDALTAEKQEKLRATTEDSESNIWIITAGLTPGSFLFFAKIPATFARKKIPYYALDIADCD